ncbi:MAG: sigma-54 dependent transcriptional regulator [bacterium]|nr:sigma-54 dependent transcriptional regulator [bacterium]
MGNVLVVDDEREIRELLATILRQRGHDTSVAADGQSALERVKKVWPDLVVLDYKLPDGDGIEILRRLKEVHSSVQVVIITGYGDIELAVEAMRSGAYDFLCKPIERETFIIRVENALGAQQLSRQVAYLKGELGKEVNLERLMGNSEKIQEVFHQIRMVAPTDATVIIQGESGTGKELVAKGIHHYSNRRNDPFIVVDCGTLPETLIESELFGYEKGAFTGATERKAGQFELAEGGTVFLDEITNLSFPAQRKLLRVLQEREIQRVGGKKTVPVNVRILAATNVNLRKAVEKGTFREDLYHRLNEFPVYVPALRERKADILILARRFLEEANFEFNRQVESISPGAMSRLMSYSWPGNVRQLKNVIKRVVLLADHVVLPRHIGQSLGADAAEEEAETEMGFDKDGVSLKEVSRKAAERAEKQVITKALREAGGNKSKAARMLKIDRSALYYKIRRLGL